MTRKRHSALLEPGIYWRTQYATDFGQVARLIPVLKRNTADFSLQLVKPEILRSCSNIMNVKDLDVEDDQVLRGWVEALVSRT
jgi:hypothetical protein